MFRRLTVNTGPVSIVTENKSKLGIIWPNVLQCWDISCISNILKVVVEYTARQILKGMKSVPMGIIWGLWLWNHKKDIVGKDSCLFMSFTFQGKRIIFKKAIGLRSLLSICLLPQTFKCTVELMIIPKGHLIAHY
jgi:hypothetical protein